MRNGYPSYNWYPSDWLSSEARAVMSLAEQGAYRNLLDHAWLRNPQCSLPDDDRALARLSGLDRAWPKSASIIRQQFVVRDGKLWNEKQLHVLQTALKFSERKSVAGKKGNEIKKAMHAQRSHGDPPAIAGATLPTPTPTPEEKKEPLATLTSVLDPPPTNGAGKKSELKVVPTDGDGNEVKPRQVKKPQPSREEAWFYDALLPLYPKHRRVQIETALAWLRKEKPDEAMRTSIIVGLERWKASADWEKNGGEFVKGVGNFLVERMFESPCLPRATGQHRALSGLVG